MVARHADSVPAVVVDGVVDDGVRSAVGIEGGDAVAAVRVDQAVHDQGTGVAPRDRDTAVALRRSVAEDPQPLEDDGQILVVAAHEGNSGATGAGDRQAANRDELRLLEADGMTVRTRRDGTAEHDAPDGSVRVGLDHDASGFGGRRGVVLALDGDLLDVAPALDQDVLAGERGADSRLDRRVARRVTAARRIRVTDVARRAGRH